MKRCSRFVWRSPRVIARAVFVTYTSAIDLSDQVRRLRVPTLTQAFC